MLTLPRARVFGEGDEPSGSSSVGKLGIDGRFFTMDGQLWTAIESSDFSLFKRFLDAERSLVNAVLGQRQAVGFNMLRVWLLNQSVIGGRNGGFDGSRVHPADYPDFYEALRLFVNLCAQFDQVVELTVFTQTQTLMPNKDDQQRHLDRTTDAVRGMGSVLLELVNEGDQHDNATADLRRPQGVFISRGSNGADAQPPQSPWDYELYHTNDLSEFQRKVGHNAMEHADASGRPCMSNENTRYPDHDSNIVHAYDAAMGAALLCAGSCYHSQAGKFSTLFAEGPELECARAWVAGARSVPLAFQRGAYRHRTEFEGSDCIRAYSRSVGGQDYVIKIRP